MEQDVSIKVKLSKRDFAVYIRSMLPELNGKIGRASIRLEEDEQNFYVYIEAPDMVSIKPAITSFNRMLLLVSRITREVE